MTIQEVIGTIKYNLMGLTCEQKTILHSLVRRELRNIRLSQEQEGNYDLDTLHTFWIDEGEEYTLSINKLVDLERGFRKITLITQ